MQLIGIVIGFLGAYSILVAARKRYPQLDHFLQQLTGQAQSTPQDDTEKVSTPAADWQHRRQALLALADEPVETALPVLLSALNDEDIDVRETAGQVLSRLGDDAVPALIDVMQTENMDARVEAARALAQPQNQRAIPVLSDTLRQDESIWVRIAAAESLGIIGGDVVDVLATALNDEAPVHDAAVRALTELDTRAARKILSQHHIPS